MAGAFNMPQRRRKPAINITPLIDVMFLLLIFFMVSSTFKEDMAIDITLPEAASAVSQEIAPHEIVVDREGRVYFGGEAVGDDALKSALGSLLADDPGATLVLRADEEADFGRVIRVIDIARELEAANLVIPTDLLTGVPEAR